MSSDERGGVGLSTKILLGLVAGVGCGLFFGEYAGWLKVVGDGFVDLLQMTVLPFITLSLTFDIGRLSPAQAKRLAGVAGATSTLTLTQLSRLEAYFYLYMAATIVLAFVVLPLLVAAAQKLFQDIGRDDEEINGEVSLLVPLAYPFPSIGKLLALLFIPFSAWFVGRSLDAGQLAMLVGNGLLSLFGSPLAAIPYLLDSFRLPADMFNLFMVSGVFATRFGDVVGTMHLLAFTLIVTCATAGLLRIDVKRLVTGAVATAALVVPDYRRQAFATLADVRRQGPLKMAILGHPRVSESFQTRMPNVELVPVESHLEFFERQSDDLDAMITAAEIGAAWTLGWGGSPSSADVAPDPQHKTSEACPYDRAGRLGMVVGKVGTTE